MDRDNLSNVNGREDEIVYWKSQAAHYKEKLEHVEQDFEDFQENSRMLERELETAIEQGEKRERDLTSQLAKIGNELEKSKTNQMQADQLTTELESKNVQYRCQVETLVKYIRELEQKNDDLERSQRALMMSLGDKEDKLNLAIERNAYLESEQDEASAIVQRLKDETKELREDMAVRAPDNDKSLRCLVDSNKAVDMDCTATSTSPATPLLIGSNGNIPMTAPTRISAMNMVGDLLRKVGALESKLASCRNASRDSPLPGDVTNRDSYRGRRISRGTTSPIIHGYLHA